MKMKKFLAMALTGAMCVGLLAGCSNGSSGTTSAPSGGSSASSPASSTAGADGAIKIGGIGPPDWLRRHLWHRHQAGG